MKKHLLTISTIATLMLLSFNSIARIKEDPLKSFSPEQMIKTYLDATINSSKDMDKYLFAEDFAYQNGNNEKTYNKKEYLTFTKANKGLIYDCETSAEVVEQYGNTCLSKVTLKFEKFTRIDYVTLSQNKGAWKVNKIVTTYP